MIMMIKLLRLTCIASFSFLVPVVFGNGLLRRVALKSCDLPIVVVPQRYLDGKISPVMSLPDSGVPEFELNIGQPARVVKAILDTVDKDVFIPNSIREIGPSQTMAIDPLGGWKDIIEVAGLKVDQEFYFIEDAMGKIGFNIDQTFAPFFKNILANKLLGMQLFSILLTRINERMLGEMLLGDLEQSMKGENIRYNPVMMDELGWSLRIFDLRIDNQYYGYKGRAMIDTTTPFVILPKAIFVAIAQTFNLPYRLNNDVLMTDPVHCQLFENLPPIYFAIETDEFVWDSVHFTISAGGKCRLAIVGFDSHLDGMPVWVLGTSFLLDRAIIFDYGIEHIGLTDYEPKMPSDNQSDVTIKVRDSL